MRMFKKVTIHWKVSLDISWKYLCVGISWSNIKYRNGPGEGRLLGLVVLLPFVFLNIYYDVNPPIPDKN